jgi:hypothetical protein
MLPTSTATVFGETRWPNLKTAKVAAAAIGIKEQRLLDLADAQLAPHWRIEGGPPQFVLSELKQWAGKELATKQEVAAAHVPCECTVCKGFTGNPRAHCTNQMQLPLASFQQEAAA